MLRMKAVSVREVHPESQLFEECQIYSEEEYLVLLVTDAIKGICVLQLDGKFLRLKPLLKIKECDESLVLDTLVEKAITVGNERFPDLIIICDSEEKNLCEYERLGFLKVSHSDEACVRLVFPPSYSVLERVRSNTVFFEQGDPADLSLLFAKISAYKMPKHFLGDQETEEAKRDVAYEFVPLVFLHRLMDVRKLGKSIVQLFLRLALRVQRIQEDTTTIKHLSTVIQDEAQLLNFAWERLNTGHFSEIDHCWRLLYAAVSFVKSVRLASSGHYLNAIAAADFGLLMGDGVPNQLLQRYAQYCDSHLSPPPKIVENNLVFPVPRTLPNSITIRTFAELSKWDFVDQFLIREEPVIIKGLNNHWPALKKWNFDYLHRTLCHRVVPVEQGSKYTDSDWAQRLMTGSEFFNSLSENMDRPLYLAQHRIFDQVPQLCDDFSLPLYCDHCENVEKNGWIGPGGTLSPLHQDPRENLFCQLVGRKFFRLVSPSESENVYAFKDGIITNTSQVDVLNPDLELYPNFAKVQCWDGIVEAGDVLFIPKGWWHLVLSLSNSVSISFWFDK